MTRTRYRSSKYARAAMGALSAMAVLIASNSPAGSQNPQFQERAYQDREILYELGPPESHAFRITHDYTERKEGTRYYFNVVREGSHPNACHVLLDGFICCAAIAPLVAANPAFTDHCLAAHRSAEGGHARLLAHLGLEPLLQLNMRLGEGSGAAVAVHLVRAALAAHNNMATFAEAAVAGAH